MCAQVAWQRWCKPAAARRSRCRAMVRLACWRRCCLGVWTRQRGVQWLRQTKQRTFDGGAGWPGPMALTAGWCGRRACYRFLRCCGCMAAMLAITGDDTRTATGTDTATVRSRVGVSVSGSMFARWLWSVAHGVVASTAAPVPHAGSRAGAPVAVPARLTLQALSDLRVHDVGSGAAGGSGPGDVTSAGASTNAPSRRAVAAMLKWMCAWVPAMPQSVLR